jgi:gamma-glutamyl-gamma-aminobutyrate hydrolase PuuD
MHAIVTVRTIQSWSREEFLGASQTLVSLLETNGFVSSLVHSQQNAKEILSLSPNLLVLSGGEDLSTNTRRDKFEESLIFHALDRNIPILGICRGLQLINVVLGGSISLIKGHVGTNHSVSGTFSGIVNSFHKFGIDKLSPQLRVLAKSEDDQIECVEHLSARLVGVMWHPERNPSEISLKDLLKRLGLA